MCLKTKTFYVIYKITNKLNGRYYIGQHKTTNINDRYMGSGKLITQAIKKYKVENFTKEIMFVFDNFEEMNTMEEMLVTEEFVKKENTYNLQPGGKNALVTEEQKRMISETLKGRKLSEEHKQNIAKHQGVYVRTQKHLDELSKRSAGRKLTSSCKNKISSNSAKSKCFEILKGKNLLFKGKNLKKFCETNNFPDSSLRRTVQTSKSICGATQATKKYAGWQLRWVK